MKLYDSRLMRRCCLCCYLLSHSGTIVFTRMQSRHTTGVYHRYKAWIFQLLRSTILCASPKVMPSASQMTQVSDSSKTSSCRRWRPLRSMAKPRSAVATLNHCNTGSEYQRVEKRRRCMNGGLASVAAFCPSRVRKESFLRR